MSRWNDDMKRIANIQFRTDYDQARKNRLIALIEEHMAKEEQKELDGKGTGYYND